MDKQGLKKAFIYSALLMIAAFLAYKLLYDNEGAYFHQQPQLILFVSSSCPHCANVRNFINQNQIYKSQPLVIKEISHYQENLNELVRIQHHCDPQKSLQSIPIPFLWTGKTCFSGDVTIINYFKQSLGSEGK